MVTTRQSSNQTWIDMNSPTKEEVDSLVLAQNISPIIAKDLLVPTPTQHAEENDGVIYVVLHIPTFKNPHSIQENKEIDFIISPNSVVTARYDSIDALYYFAKQIEVSEILNRNQSSHLFFGIMGEILKSMEDELAFMEDWMKEIEKNIFEGQEKEMVFAVSNTGRNLLNFKRTIDSHGNILSFLAETGKEKFGDRFGIEAKIMMEKWHHIMKRVNNQMDLIAELRETNNSMLSTKQNEVMKNLAVIGSVLLPLTIIGQIFGMSVRTFPLIDNPHAFWMILAIMVSAALASIVFAKLKKWI